MVECEVVCSLHVQRRSCGVVELAVTVAWPYEETVQRAVLLCEVAVACLLFPDKQLHGATAICSLEVL